MTHETRSLDRGEITTEKLLDKIYVELFKSATPSADFHAMCKSGEAKLADFFMYYYLNDSMQEEIVNRICASYRLGRIETSGVMQAVMLGCSPNGNHGSWLAWRAKLEKDKKRWKRIPNRKRAEARARFIKKLKKSGKKK